MAIQAATLKPGSNKKQKKTTTTTTTATKKGVKHALTIAAARNGPAAKKPPARPTTALELIDARAPAGTTLEEVWPLAVDPENNTWNSRMMGWPWPQLVEYMEGDYLCEQLVNRATTIQVRPHHPSSASLHSSMI